MAENEEFLEHELACLKGALNELISSSSILEEFGPVWWRIGLSSSQLQVRKETITLHVSNLLKDILQEEQELEKSMIISLQNNEVELVTLCEQLCLPKEKLLMDQSLYEREKATRNRVDALNKVKFDRQKRMKRIREMENSLCKDLGEKSKLPGKSHLPSEEELKQYLQGVENLEHTLNERRARHHEIREHVQEVSRHLGLELEEEFAVLSADTKKTFVYSLDNMIKMEEAFQKFDVHVKEMEKETNELRFAVESLWKRLDVPTEERQKVLEKVESFRLEDIQVFREELQRLDELKRHHMEGFISKTRAELREIWTDCLYGMQQQKEFAPAFVDGPFDDDLLSAHESELDRMRGFYLDNLDIFKLIKKRDELFKQYCELERKDNDPMRFSNRGGQLLKDQTLKKQVKKELPRVEKELNGVLEQWEEDHERFFIVHDSRYLDTVKLQWRDKENTKCSEKLKRQKEKEATTKLEMTYGSRPTTPKKLSKRVAASPLANTAPTKLRKVEQSPIVRPTTAAGSRLPRASRSRNANKTPVRPIQRRQQERRKILGDKNAPPSDESFLSSHNFSLASAGSYTDFQHGIMLVSEMQKHSRSTAILPKSSSMENIDN